jgi:hypothetical protein
VIFFSSCTIPLVDNEGRILAVCLGFPHGDETWHEVIRQAAKSLDQAGQTLHFGKTKNRRGDLRALSVGISHGGGQTHPKILRQDPRNKTMIGDMMKESAFLRISGFTSGLSPDSCQSTNCEITMCLHSRCLSYLGSATVPVRK